MPEHVEENKKKIGWGHALIDSQNHISKTTYSKYLVLVDRMAPNDTTFSPPLLASAFCSTDEFIRLTRLYAKMVKIDDRLW